jgi:hypothetical protein
MNFYFFDIRMNYIKNYDIEIIRDQFKVTKQLTEWGSRIEYNRKFP